MNSRVEEVFHQVADLPPDARAQYFAEHGVDEDTRHEVEALLSFDSSASADLQRDIGIVAGRALPQLDAKGWRCGPYRLLDLIGRGGMGAVYLAERADGEVTQRVAVKLLPPGAGDIHHERFLQERQILAALTHANIARMVDAGHLDNGQPFLAMEYVEGQPIDLFASGLGVRQKIALFLKVSDAVGYLHRNLVVHRDLKPGNILVTAEGEPKLLDFGIAKILDLGTDATVTSMRMLTPDYASPEQVTGGRVSTATDIYSLGAVLYRLLTGKAAHEFDGQSLEGVAAAVATREVTRPSKWAPELKGDLESILLKALRNDPQERYGTVEQFAEDLQAFLESRPVRARSGNAWYRTRKFVRRYWVFLAAAGLVIASLSVGLYIANRQRLIAERRFVALHEQSNKLLQLEMDVGSSLELGVVDINLRVRIISLSIQYLEGLSREALHDRALALEIGNAYNLIARNQGVPGWNHQGRYDEALKSLAKADQFADSVLQANPRDREGLWLSANIAHDRALVGYAQHSPERVLTYASKTVADFDRLSRLGILTRKEINGATYMYAQFADVHIALHRFEDAVRYARRAIEYSQSAPSVIGPRGQAFDLLAGALMYLGDFQGALEASAEARNLWEKLRHAEGDTTYTRLMLFETRCREGQILGEDGGVNMNRPQEAAVALQEAFAALEEDTQKSKYDYQARSNVAVAGHYLGDVLRHTDPRRALTVYDHALMRIREVPNDIEARRVEALLLAGSSYAARWIRREGDARKRIDAAFRLLRETTDYPTDTIKPGSEADTAVRALADHYAETGEPTKALGAYQELYGKIMASNPGPENDLVNAAHISRLNTALAALLRRAGNRAAAAAMEESRSALWRNWDRKLPNNPFVQRQLAAAGQSSWPVLPPQFRNGAVLVPPAPTSRKNFTPAR